MVDKGASGSWKERKKNLEVKCQMCGPNFVESEGKKKTSWTYICIRLNQVAQ